MKKVIPVGLSIVIAVVMLSVIPVLAWDCSNTYNTVKGYYEKSAKVAGVDQAKLEQAKKLLDEGFQAHQGGNHRKMMDNAADAMKLITAARP